MKAHEINEQRVKINEDEIAGLCLALHLREILLAAMNWADNHVAPRIIDLSTPEGKKLSRYSDTIAAETPKLNRVVAICPNQIVVEPHPGLVESAAA